MRRSSLFAALALTILLAVATPAATAAEFPLKDGDIWVMAGDSITAQHLHSNYFEAFCYARYPKLKFAFRNSGVGGHTIPSTLDRFGYDIEAWKPTVVSVELGMNDSGGTPTEKFVSNMGTMVGRIRGINARPVILTASPVNDGTTQAQLNGRNVRLDEYAKALKEFSAKEKLPFGDQFHMLLDTWGANKPREVLASSLPSLRALAQDDKLPGNEHLKKFLEAHDKFGPRPVSMGGDPVHPGPVGQLMMAAALLSELGADPFVSTVTIQADGKLVEAKGCAVDGILAADGTLAFDRLDECLPFPIPADAAAGLAMYPPTQDMSQYILKVPGLKTGLYTLKINGVATNGSMAEHIWARGINLTGLANSPVVNPEKPNAIQIQGKAVLDAVSAKEGLVGQWRGLSQKAHAPGAAPELKEQLAVLALRVEDADAKIREAARPQKIHFELAPAK